MFNQVSFGIHYCTLTLVRRPGEVLLGIKTDKIGKGLYNGAGGVIEQGEDVHAATMRELKEETGLVVQKRHIIPTAIVDCYNRDKDGKPKNLTKVFVSQVFTFSGRRKDSSELVKQTWFPVNKLPYERMLPGDRSWIRLALGRKRFIACVYYGQGMKILERETAISPLDRELLNRLWVRP